MVRVSVLTVVGLTSAWLLAGCAQQSGDAYDPELVAKLKERAEVLAEKELARFREAEQVYRETSRRHRNKDHPFDPDQGVYAKTYRDFEGYVIEDIIRSQSLLRPYTYVITFTGSVMSTEGRPTDDGNSPELSRQDDEYRPLREVSITRRYPCYPSGEYDGSLPDALEPVPYFMLYGKDAGGTRPAPPAPPSPADIQSMLGL